MDRIRLESYAQNSFRETYGQNSLERRIDKIILENYAQNSCSETCGQNSFREFSVMPKFRLENYAQNSFTKL